MRLIDTPGVHTLNTADAAVMLNFSNSHAMQTMKKHKLEYIRCGKSMRWIAREVMLLAEALRRDAGRPAERKLWS